MACAETISASRLSLGVCSPGVPLATGITANFAYRVGKDNQGELTGWCVCFESSDRSGLRNLVRAAVVHIDSLEEQYVALLSHPRGDSLHDLTVDRLLVVGDEVLVQELLNLVRGEPGSVMLVFVCGASPPDPACTYIQQMSWMISMSFRVAFFSWRSLVACCGTVSFDGSSRKQGSNGRGKDGP